MGKPAPTAHLVAQDTGTIQPERGREKSLQVKENLTGGSS
jgi:hypothetical protein